MHLQASGVGVRHEVGGLAEIAVGVTRNDVALFGADARGVARDGLQAFCGCHLRIGQFAATYFLIVGLPTAKQLDQAQLRQAAEGLEVLHFKGLDVDRRTAACIAVAVEDAHQWFFHSQAKLLEVRRVLGFRVQTDAAALAQLHGFHQIDDLLQRRDFQAAVEPRVTGTDRWDALDGAQGFQLGQGEVFAEPAGELHAVDHLRALAVGEFGVL